MFAAFNWFLDTIVGSSSEWIGEYTIQYENVRFKQEFGPFQKDEVVDTLEFNFETADCIEYGANGEVLRSCKFGIAAFDGAADTE